MNKVLKFLIIALMAMAPVFCSADTVVLTLKNGTTIIGDLVSLDPTSVVEVNVAGFNTKIYFSDIEKIEKKEQSSALSTEGSVDISNLPKEKTINIAGHDVKFVLVEGGTITYGYDGPVSNTLNSEPVHDITLSSFYVSEDPVSYTLYKDATGLDPWLGYTLTYEFQKKHPDLNEENEKILNDIQDICLLGVASDYTELTPFSMRPLNCGRLVKDIPTASSFIKKLREQSLPEDIDVLSEAQWAYIYKNNIKDVKFPLKSETVRTISMTQNQDPTTVGFTTKGISKYIDTLFKVAHVDAYDNRLPQGQFKVDKKKKKILYGSGWDLVAPFHLVFPAK